MEALTSALYYHPIHQELNTPITHYGRRKKERLCTGSGTRIPCPSPGQGREEASQTAS